MKNVSVPHILLTNLPTEARALFSIYAVAALARYRSAPPALSTLSADLDAVWNANKLILRDLSDPHSMTALLEEHFAPLMDGETKKTRALG